MNQLRLWGILAFSFSVLFQTNAQENTKISLEAIFKENFFSQESVHGINWMKDGKYYSTLIQEDGHPKVIQINLQTGQRERVLINGKRLNINFTSYSLNNDETKALVASASEAIYRRSTKAVYHIVDLINGESRQLMEGNKISYATLSPDNHKVAFVMDNNLFYTDLQKNQTHQVTKDGKWNHVINGAADWVYEEEFAMSQAFQWSPDGKHIAFIRFDETEVPEYNMQLWGGLYPLDYVFKYPKAGEENAKVSIHVFHLEDNKTTTIDTGKEKDSYLPRIYWTGSADNLAYIRLNRIQNQLDLYQADIFTGKTQNILSEKSATYVDLNYNDHLIYLKKGKGFIRTSEQDGYKHIYHHDLEGKLIKQITTGKWEVTELVGVDEKSNRIFYLSNEQSPLERNFYSIQLNGKSKKLLTPRKGDHEISLSHDYKYFIDYYSNAGTPLHITLKDQKGNAIKVLEDNQALRERLGGMDLPYKEFFTINSADETALNAYIIKPTDFDAQKEYPVLMYVYGGPGSQNTTNSWGGIRDFWHQFLASEGYLIVGVDNRGTGGRGRDFKHLTYGQLGKLEAEDQIIAARHLASLPYVDANRIGIWGWSYGGYLSSLSLMLGHDIFKAAIAVAPVTTWRYYDTIYTERYLQTPQLNPSGYDQFSPINHVQKLKGELLLIHGTGDDNVHFQNTVDLVNALVDADKQFETFYYPNRNHTISGGNTRWHLYRMMTDFIKRKL